MKVFNEVTYFKSKCTKKEMWEYLVKMTEKNIRIKKVEITEEFNELGFKFTGPMYTTLWV